VVTGEAVRVADEGWIALALLQRANPERASFSPREILEQAKLERAAPELRPGLQPHIYLHNVANIAPNSATYRLFFRLEDGTLRLFRPGDAFHPDRHGKTSPKRSELPLRYHELLDWYEQVYCAESPEPEDSVLAMAGVGADIWAGVDADAYVANLRAGWLVEPSN
jgi:hypothetical protein